VTNVCIWFIIYIEESLLLLIYKLDESFGQLIYIVGRDESLGLLIYKFELSFLNICSSFM